MSEPLQLLRSHPAHIGTGSFVTSTTNTKEINTTTVLAQNDTGASQKTDFKDYLLQAVSYVNDNQQTVSSLSQQLIVDPDSVDPHDVTTAMAKANLSLSLAQNVIHRLTQAWSEITTNR